LNFDAYCIKLLILRMFWGFPRHGAQSLEQPGRDLPQRGRNRPAGRENHNGGSIDGAKPARLREGSGRNCPVAPLQALDAFQPPRERQEFGVFAQQLGKTLRCHRMK
jgi:hypothetical protein